MAKQIVPGITLSPTGEASVDAATGKLLFDLAIQLEDLTDDPVDVQHVLAAIILAAQSGKLPADKPLSATDKDLTHLLLPHIKTVFKQYDGKLGREDT